MPAKIISCLLFIALATAGAAHASDLMTLFTTPEERQIINANRYKTEEKPEPVDESREVPELPMQQLVLEEVTREYAVSGITVSQDGADTVWINSAIYEDGEKLDGESPVRVMNGEELRVRITAPDGKQYYARSGETVEVKFMAPMEN